MLTLILLIDGIENARVGDAVSVSHLYTEESMTALVVVELHGQPEIKLPLLERVTRLETHGNVAVRSEIITSPNIELIYKSFSATIAEV